MMHIHRKAQVSYSAEKMYALVNDVEHYPKFLLWCKSARIISHTEKSMRASLVLSKGGIHKTFTTENTLTPSTRIDIALVDGPFKHLAGHWHFEDQADNASVVELDLEFEFASHWLEVLIGPVFEEIAQTLVQSFKNEAKRRYG